MPRSMPNAMLFELFILPMLLMPTPLALPACMPAMASTRLSAELDALRSYIGEAGNVKYDDASGRLDISIFKGSSSKAQAHISLQLPAAYPCDDCDGGLGVTSHCDGDQSDEQMSCVSNPIVLYVNTPEKQNNRAAAERIQNECCCSSDECLISAVAYLEEWLECSEVYDARYEHATHAEPSADEQLVRTAAWTHHIHNVNKKRDIPKLASECCIKGIVKHGQPGLFVLEGRNSDIQQFLRRIKQWKWKAFAERRREKATEEVFHFDGVHAFTDMHAFKQACIERNCEHLFHSALQLR